MKRTLCIVLTLACLIPLFAPAAAWAEANELLNAVPGQAWGMISVRSLAELDKKLVNLGQAVNAPTAGMSPLAMAKGVLGLLAGVNDSGGLALVIMPFESIDQIGQRMAILVPTSNYTELLSLLEPEDAGGGMTKIMFRGTESYVAPKGGFAVIGSSIEAVKAVVQSTTGVASKLTPHQREQWAAADLTVWIDAAAVTGSPAFTEMSAKFQAPGFDEESLSSLKSVQASLSFGPEGVRLGLYADAQPGTRMAKAMASVKPPSGSLLTGLPGDAFVAAFGTVTSNEAAAYGAESVDESLEALAPIVPMLNPEAFARLRSIFKTLMSRMRTLSFSISALPEGPDGVLAATKIIGVEGGASSYLASIAELVRLVQGELIQDEELANTVKTVLEYQPAPEGGSIDHLVVHLDRLEWVGEEELGMVTKILGKEGLLVRYSAVDENHVAITLGGGAARMQTVAELIKGEKAPLPEVAEIKKLASTMPPDRVSEGYFSVNGLMTLFRAIAKATDGEVPIEMPPVGTPLAVSARITADGGGQMDALIPMELIKALVQAATATMGPGAPAEPPPM